MKLSLCLDMLFADLPFVQRIKSAADCGYRAFEFWDWRDKPIEAVVQASRAWGLSVAAMSGNRRHALIDPAARGGLVAEMREVLEVAGRLSCHNIMMLSDVLASDGSTATASTMTRDQKIEPEFCTDKWPTACDRTGSDSSSLAILCTVTYWVVDRK